MNTKVMSDVTYSFGTLSRSHDSRSVYNGTHKVRLQVDHCLALPAAESSQEDMWVTCGAELVAKFLAGFNTTLLAYGQTGSGKTYTMGIDGALRPTAHFNQNALEDTQALRVLRSAFPCNIILNYKCIK